MNLVMTKDIRTDLVWLNKINIFKEKNMKVNQGSYSYDMELPIDR